MQLSQCRLSNSTLIKTNPAPPIPEPYFYWLGDESTDLTGGWRSYTGELASGTATKETDHLYIQSASGSAYRMGFETTNKVDLTDIDTLYLVWEGSMTSTGFVSMAVSASANEPADGVAQWFLRETGTFTERTDSLDVSALTGTYYIQVRCQSNSTQIATAQVYKVYGE